jgi:hypothetical protein
VDGEMRKGQSKNKHKNKDKKKKGNPPESVCLFCGEYEPVIDACLQISIGMPPIALQSDLWTCVLSDVLQKLHSKTNNPVSLVMLSYGG